MAVKLKNDTPSAVVDNGRRGQPIMGCDCVQCFGYCMIDGEEQQRLRSEAKTTKAKEATE
jgi:hypothetical protein